MIVKAWGSWVLFQELLVVLRGVGDRHSGASISNVATRWVLDQPAVGAVIIGEYLFRRLNGRLFPVALLYHCQPSFIPSIHRLYASSISFFHFTILTPP
jgi:hypothetical protein